MPDQKPKELSGFGKRGALFGSFNLVKPAIIHHAKDYVKAMWLMLQQDKPDNFVCSTGVSHSVKDLVEYTFNKLDLDWKQYIKTDPKFLRPEELRDLKGDSTKLRKLGWKPDYTFETMIDEMINYWVEIL